MAQRNGRAVQAAAVDADHARVRPGLGHGHGSSVEREGYSPETWCRDCGGHVMQFLGVLGRLAWFKCSACRREQALRAEQVEGLGEALSEWESTEH